MYTVTYRILTLLDTGNHEMWENVDKEKSLNGQNI